MFSDICNHCKIISVSVKKTGYNPTNCDRTQIKDTTKTKYPVQGGYLLKKWYTKCNVKSGAGKIQNIIRSTETESPTSNSGSRSLRPFGDSFMYNETISNKCSSEKIFDFLEQKYIVQISKFTFHYKRFSI